MFNLQIQNVKIYLSMHFDDTKKKYIINSICAVFIKQILVLIIEDFLLEKYDLLSFKYTPITFKLWNFIIFKGFRTKIFKHLTTL